MTEGKPDTIVERLKVTREVVSEAYADSQEVQDIDDALAHIEAQDAEIALREELINDGLNNIDALRAQLAARDETIEGLRAEVKSEKAWYDKVKEQSRLREVDCSNLETENARLREQLAEARAIISEAKCPQFVCQDGLVPVFADDKWHFHIENCKWCIARDLFIAALTDGQPT